MCKILVSKDVKFMEDQQWNCDEPIRKQLLETPQLFDDEVNEILVKGTRSIYDIYQRCNVRLS